MAEKIEQPQQTTGSQNVARNIHHHSPDFQTQRNSIVPSTITRERSFVRTTNNQQNINKRRSLAFNSSGNQQGQLRSQKPAMDIYRPPKLNFNLQHSSSSSMVFPASSPTGVLPQSKSSAYFHPQMPYIVTTKPMPINNRQQAANLQMRNMTMPNLNAKPHHHHVGGHRSILVTHSQPLQANHLMTGDTLSQQQNANRVKFAAEPQKYHKPQQQQPSHHLQPNNNNNNNNLNYNYQLQQQTQQQQQQQQQHQQQQPHLITTNSILNGMTTPYSSANNMNSPLQRSKSLSSADALTSGIAGLGLALGNDVTDIGQFTPEIQALIDTALQDPNKLNSRCLMDLSSHFIKRAVDGRRYALPISRLCLNIIAKEQKETFLEALLNTCRQWYQEREKLLYTIQGMKSPSRSRFTAFMAFLTEMFCQLKRRQLQLRTKSEGISPPLVLLTLLSKCCEDCVRPPVRSLSEIECLFYVLTCIGLDMEAQQPQQLEVLLSLLRDAFLNSSDSAPAIRRTLLQLIELQASHWQLPGNTVLYYYPSK